MDDWEAERRYQRLLTAVEAARRLLVDASERHWAGWMDGAYRDLAAHDANGLRRILGAYGGIGSFNDLVLHPANGHSVRADDVRRVNEELDELRSSMYADASTLLRDFERPV